MFDATLSLADSVLALMRAGTARWNDERVRAAYDELAGRLETVLGDDTIYEGSPLTETQLVFVRQALRSLSANPNAIAELSRLRAAAAGLQTAITSASPALLGKTITPTGVSGEAVNRLGLRAATVRARAGQAASQMMSEIGSRVGAHHDARAYTPPAPFEMPTFVSDEEFDTPSRHTYDVFLSYSREDARTMRRLAADLRAHNLNVWTDENLSIGTPSWTQAVETAARASACLVALLSPDARKNVWMEREMTMAKANGKPILAVIIRGDERSALPLALNSAPWLDMRRERDYKMNLRKLLRTVKTHMETVAVG